MQKKNEVRQKNRPYIVAMFGTALEHYDTSLYGFMAPILISVFLPEINMLNALIISYAFYPINIISRPIGAIVLGRYGDQHGRRKALILSLLGTAIITGIIGLLPTYNDIGIWAPILFTMCRFIQGFFSGGEYNGGAIYVLEHSGSAHRGWISGVYCAYTVLGILIAAIVSAVVSYFPEYWRWPYIAAWITGLIGVYIRLFAHETPEFIESKAIKHKPISVVKVIAKYYPTLLAMIVVSGFFGTLYTLPSILMNAFVPLITSISTSTIMNVNVGTTLLYMTLLPVSGFISDKISYKKSMSFAAIATALLTYPLLLLLSYNELYYVIIMKIIFAILSAWFIGPFHAWAQSLCDTKNRYLIISLTYAIGGQIGGVTPAISLVLWKYTHNLLHVAFVLIIWAMIASIAAYYAKYINLAKDMK
ncbi:Proline/betaine transporter [Rickettsiales bacterium Ac37b]|nr:Proline/betaine transporter [Rickettsiales bacterium Ac37b]